MIYRIVSLGLFLLVASNGLMAQLPVAPTISHEGFREPIDAMVPLTIAAEVSNQTRIESVKLFYKSGPETKFESVEMLNVERNLYVFNLPAEAIQSPSLQYYIQAQDKDGNTVFRGGRLFPLSVDVLPPAVAKQDKSMKPVWKWVLGAIGIGAVAALAGGGGGGSGSSNPPQPTSLTISGSPTVPTP